MLRSLLLLLAFVPATALAQTAAPAEPAPGAHSGDASPAPAAEPAPPAAAPQQAPAATENPPPPSAEQQRFEQFRRDLVNLLALRAEPHLLVAAAELAFPDAADKDRIAGLKSPALIGRAQKFGPDDPLVWWVSTFLCSDAPDPCHEQAAARLQHVAADNAAAWLPSLHATRDSGRARALLATMAQAKRFDDYWAAGVLAVYDAVKTLPVPEEVLHHGLNTTAARINLATGVGGGFLPNYARLGELCRAGDRNDEALVSDCLAVARLLESGGSFRSQLVGFSIEDSLLPDGTARDVMRARQRSSVWQKQQFLELSARFPRDEALAQTYMTLLRRSGDELTTVTAFLRDQHISTDPPADWQPPQANPTAPATPLELPPGH